MGTAKLEISLLTPWIEARFSRSPGPGGQNVNKVNTRVTLLFDVAACAALSESQKTRIVDRLRTRMSRDGRLRVVSHRERTQARNRAAAETRLLELLAEATHKPKSRRKTKPTLASRARRLAYKRLRGEVKRQRKSAPGPNDIL